MCPLPSSLPPLSLKLQLTAAGARPRGQSSPQASVRGQSSPQALVRGQGYHRPQSLGIRPICCSQSLSLSHGWSLGSPVSLCTCSWRPILFSRCQMMSPRWGRVAVVLGGGLFLRKKRLGNPQEAGLEARQGESYRRRNFRLTLPIRC